YQQDDRDSRSERLRQKLEPSHSFMIRVRVPGGIATPAQWLALDDLARKYGDNTLRLTTRQAFQFHGVAKGNLKKTISGINDSLLDTIAACGDVNRNVMCSPIEGLDPEHTTGGRKLAHTLADELAPRSSSFFQVFVSDPEGRNAGPVSSDEPIYGEHYLPRKFKIGIAHPTDNSVDVLTQDVGLVPVDGDGASWDLYSGGGLGLTHNMPKTAALLGLYLGRIRREQVVDAVRGIVILQKENGERKDRRQARWKYTIRRLGVEAVQQELRERFGVELAESEAVPLPPMDLHLGWHDQADGRSWYGISVENGRMGSVLRKAVRRAVEELGLTVRCTAQQDLLLCDVADRAALERILEEGRVEPAEAVSLARRNAMACPAKPTCGLAMTEAETILPRYFDAIEEAGLGDVDVVVRMTGCPNNCARPPSAEIGIYGYGKNDHVILVGGSRQGSRLAHELYARLPEEQMVQALLGLFRAIQERNHEGLPAGDFLHQTHPEQLRKWVGLEDG
ncbi:MAG: NADPH-dependent assimilatory sulfite reductase hemoprotein subunit, partial [Myxococcota bacterium]